MKELLTLLALAEVNPLWRRRGGVRKLILRRLKSRLFVRKFRK